MIFIVVCSSKFERLPFSRGLALTILTPTKWFYLDLKLTDFTKHVSF